MRVVNRIRDLRVECDHAREQGATVGLVPTMGALHEGHGSLIRRSAGECDLTAVSVFVNPLQFGPAEDLDAYPRDLRGDVGVAGDAGAGLVFAPDVTEMYPEPPTTTVEVGPLATGYEGSSRPGHFAGMATVVAKLFNAAGPCRAYFGEKDYQQLLIVRRMARDLSFPVEVVACPTVRDGDGLALSSRNAHLDAADRQAATVLFRALTRGVALLEAGERDAAVVEREIAGVIGSEPRARLDYVAVVSAGDLGPVEQVAGEVRVLAAAWFGGTRLIDNVAALQEGETLCDVA